MALPTEMKAWRAHAYGAEGNPADTIGKMTLDTVPVPEPKKGQVLVTFPYVPGFDISGTVAKLGEGVTSLAVGDEVCVDLGLCETCCNDSPCGPAGGFAEYAVALADTVAKRDGLSSKDLVGLPLAGLTAYQAIFTGAGRDFTGAELGKLGAGQKLLVLGGAAATGTIDATNKMPNRADSPEAIQLAKSQGAYVATTASPNKTPEGIPKVEYMKQLGADEVINYKALAGKDYDLIFDCVGTPEDWPKASKVLKKGGTFVSIANFGEAKSTEDHTFKVFLLKSNSEDLTNLVALVKEGYLAKT